MPTDPVQPVLYRDDHLVIVHKPSGLAVHRSDRVRDDTVAMTLARDAVGARVHPVHRLDRGTSGVLVFALDPQVTAAVQAQIEDGSFHKQYLALVRGIPPEEILLDHPVPRARKSPERIEARTTLRRLAVAENRWSWVEAWPHTGRTHQIRRHLKHLSCPIVGDVHYGKGDVNRLFRERFGLHRLALHAASVRFVHPVTGEALRVSASLPEDLASTLAGLGIDQKASVSPLLPNVPGGFS